MIAPPFLIDLSRTTAIADTISNPEAEGPSGGWGSFKGISSIKPGGIMCVSCAWPKPVNYHPFEFCENGAKAILWELTSHRCTPDFSNEHTVSELATGKITMPHSVTTNARPKVAVGTANTTAQDEIKPVAKLISRPHLRLDEGNKQKNRPPTPSEAAVS